MDDLPPVNCASAWRALPVLLALSSGAHAQAPDGGGGPALPPWLSALRADISVTAESVSWQGWDFTAVDVPVAMRGARLEILSGRFSVADGRFEFTVHHDPAGETRLSAEGRGLRPSAYAPLAPYIDGVPLTVNLDLHGSGHSLEALARTATGSVRARNTGGGRLLRPSESTMANALVSLLSAVMPFADDTAALAVECVAIDWTFRHGHAHAVQGAELLTPRIRVTGGGDIDLGDVTVRVALRPSARAGIDPASLALAGTVWVEGPLAAPAVLVEPRGILGKAATFGGGAVATLSGARLLGAVTGTDSPSLCSGERD